MDEKEEWKKLKTVIKIDSERYIKSEKKSTKETRYYISSLPADAEKINSAIRKHWFVENKLHWTLDVIFGEDASQKRKKNSAANFSIINKIAMSLLSKDKTVKLSMRAKRYRASMDQELREKILKI
jgi:predicted transposase YbfD/YdcC